MSNGISWEIIQNSYGPHIFHDNIELSTVWEYVTVASMTFAVYVLLIFIQNPTVLVAADNAIKVSYLAREVDVPYFTSVTFLFCRSVTLGLQSSVISYQESVSTRPPRSLALQGGWLQRYAYSTGKEG